MMVPDRFIDLLRHGEVAGGARWCGRYDDPLTAAGMQQLQRVVAHLAAQDARLTDCWDCILCSPARRCAQFAQQLAAERQLPVGVLASGGERDFGAWEGVPMNQLPSDQLTQFWTHPAEYTPPNGESFAAFHARITALWQQLQSQSTWHHALFITHGGVIRIMIGELLSIAPAALLLLEVPLASVTRIRIPLAPWRPSLVFHGCPNAPPA